MAWKDDMSTEKHQMDEEQSIVLQSLTNSETSSQNEEQRKTDRNQLLAVLAVSYLCISCGNFLGYTSSAIVSMKEDVHSNFTHINKHDESWIGSLGPLGAVCGGVLSTIPIKYFGVRRTIFYFGSILFVASWAVVGNANVLWLIFLGRFLGGIATAIVISCAPLYVVEISSIEQRGRLGVLPQGLMLLGILISFSLGNFLNWRWVARVCGLIALPSIILLKFTPDTPSFLLSRQTKWNKGLEVLQMFHDTAKAELEYERLTKRSYNQDCEKHSPVSTRFSRANMKACAVAIAIMSFQQLTGINGVTFYAVTIFKKTGADRLCSPHLFPVFLICSQIIGSFTSSMIIERVGRKTLLSISTGCISCMAAVLGFYFYFDGVSHQNLFWIPLLSLIIYVGTFALGLGSTAWIYVSETLPEQIRQLTNPLIIGYTWFCVFLITKSFPLLLSEIHIHGIFWMYSSFALSAFIFVHFYVPETKGKSTKEIEYYFTHGTFSKPTMEINPNSLIKLKENEKEQHQLTSQTV